MEPPPPKRSRVGALVHTSQQAGPRLKSFAQKPHEKESELQSQAALLKLIEWAESGKHQGLEDLMMKIQQDSADYGERQQFMDCLREAATFSTSEDALQSLSRNISPPTQSRPSSPPTRYDRQIGSRRNWPGAYRTPKPSLNGRNSASSRSTMPPTSNLPLTPRAFQSNIAYPRQPGKRCPRNTPYALHGKQSGHQHPSQQTSIPPRPPTTSFGGSYSVVEIDDDISFYPLGARFVDSTNQPPSPMQSYRPCTSCKNHITKDSSKQLCDSCASYAAPIDERSSRDSEVMALDSPNQVRPIQEHECVDARDVPMGNIQDDPSDAPSKGPTPLPLGQKRQRAESVIDLTGSTGPDIRPGDLEPQSATNGPATSSIAGDAMVNKIIHWREGVADIAPPPPATASIQGTLPTEESIVSIPRESDAQTIKKLKDRNEDLQIRVKKLETAGKKDKDDLAEQTRRWSHEKSKLEEDLKKSKRQGANSANHKKKVNQDLKQRLKEAKAQLQSVQQYQDSHSPASLKDQLNKLEAAVASKDKEIAELKRERVFAQKTIESLQEAEQAQPLIDRSSPADLLAVIETNNVAKTLEAELAEIKSECLDLGKTCQHERAKRIDLEADNKELKSRLERLEAANAVPKTRIEDLESKKQNLETELADLKTNFSTIKRENRRQRDLNNENLQHNSSLVECLHTKDEIGSLGSIFHRQKIYEQGRRSSTTRSPRMNGLSPSSSVSSVSVPLPLVRCNHSSTSVLESKLDCANIEIHQLKQENRNLQALSNGSSSSIQFHPVMSGEISFVRKLDLNAKIEEIKQRTSRKETFGEMGMPGTMQKRGACPHVSRAVRKQVVSVNVPRRYDLFESNNPQRRRRPNEFVHGKSRPSKQKKEHNSDESDDSEYEGGESSAENESLLGSGSGSDVADEADGQEGRVNGVKHAMKNRIVEVSSHEEPESDSEEDKAPEVGKSQKQRRLRFNMDEMSMDEGTDQLRDDAARQKQFERMFNVPEKATPVVDGRNRLSIRTGQRNHKGEVPRVAPYFLVGRKLD